MAENLKQPSKEKNMSNDEKINCGLVMPIAAMTDYNISQFSDVKHIIIETVKSISTHNFNPRLVSDSEGEIDIIHKSIVTNLYSDPIVIVDISGRNGNVMLELGLRLAFDKPVIIIKDDKTDYMFDISMIEHIEYPSDLRHNEIEKFKLKLADKVVQTYEKSIKDPEYSTFLKHFQKITVKSIGQDSVESDKMLEMISERLFKIEDILSFQTKEMSAKETFSISENDLVNFIINSFTLETLPSSKNDLIKSKNFRDMFFRTNKNISISDFAFESALAKSTKILKNFSDKY